MTNNIKSLEDMLDIFISLMDKDITKDMLLPPFENSTAFIIYNTLKTVAIYLDNLQNITEDHSAFNKQAMKENNLRRIN